MKKYMFEVQNPLRVNITRNELNLEEMQLVYPFITWTKPEVIVPHIIEMHGRSVVLITNNKNSNLDEMVNGQYTGLQIIGCGGHTTEPIINRKSALPKQMIIYPPNEKNHAVEFQSFVAETYFTDNGELVSENKPYVPAHGMDSSEAKIRKVNTSIARSWLSSFNSTHRSNFILPKLALEGEYIDKLDNNLNSLQFQIYRVPPIKRLPAQLFSSYMIGGMHRLEEGISLASELMGITLRNIHVKNMAYIQGHLGNVSLVDTEEDIVLYITDLGSMKEISNNANAPNYETWDFYQWITSTHQLIDMIGELKHNTKFSPETTLKILDCAAQKLMEGYFTPEIDNNPPMLNTTKQIGTELINVYSTSNLNSFLQLAPKLHSFKLS